MKCKGKYTVVEYEYTNEREAELHAEAMQRGGYTETSVLANELLKPKNKLIKAYKLRHHKGVFY